MFINLLETVGCRHVVHDIDGIGEEGRKWIRGRSLVFIMDDLKGV